MVRRNSRYNCRRQIAYITNVCGYCFLMSYFNWLATLEMFWGFILLIIVETFSTLWQSYIVLFVSLLSKIENTSKQSNCLFAPLKSKSKLFEPTVIFYVLCRGLFWINILKTFSELIIVSTYCLNLSFRWSCPYWRKQAFLNIICTSVLACEKIYFFGLNNFIISVLSKQFILKSIFTG